MRKATAKYYVRKQINTRRIDNDVAKSKGAAMLSSRIEEIKKRMGMSKGLSELYTDWQILFVWIVGAVAKESLTRKIEDRILSNTKASQ
jgi:hypothetical protein